jgi:RNA polymerase sigma factor (sigma-70 family)
VVAAAKEPSDSRSDAALIRAVRQGDTSAFGVLYARHLGAARRMAGALVATSSRREDLTAEAFTRILQALRAGHGPREAFRPYLLVTLRNLVISSARVDAQVSWYAEVPDTAQTTRHDPLADQAQATITAEAFASLPERWRTVLWHMEIEGETPAAIAPLLGMKPNSVAALAYRAREGLRQAYLRQHVPTIEHQHCRAIAEQLASWVRAGRPRHRMRRVSKHLDGCTECRALAEGLTHINDNLRGLIGPIMLGAPLALATLTGSTGPLTTSATVAAAATNTGIATASWLTTAKTVVAGAALITTTAVATLADDPTPNTTDGNVAVTMPDKHPVPSPPERGSDQAGPTRTTTPPPAPPSRGRTPTAPTQPDRPAADTPMANPATATATDTTQATKKAAKAEKQPAKAEKQAAKAEKKAAQTEKKATKKGT